MTEKIKQKLVRHLLLPWVSLHPLTDGFRTLLVDRHTEQGIAFVKREIPACL